MSSDPVVIQSIERFLRKLQAPAQPRDSHKQKVKLLFHLILKKISEETQILFTSVFARISYITVAYKLHYKEAYLLHAYRRMGDHSKQEHLEARLGLMAIQILLSHWLRKPSPDMAEIETLFVDLGGNQYHDQHQFKRLIRVELQKVMRDNTSITAQLCEEPFASITINYGISDRNEDYKPLMNRLDDLNILPIMANLIDVEIYEDGTYAPSSIVFEPDLLYTVTSIADCFGSFTSHDMGFLLKKFSATPTSSPLIIGNIANYFLDQLIFKPDLTFDEAVQYIFRIDPLGLTRLDNHEIRKMIQELKVHFDVLQDVVNNQLETIHITAKNGMVEPAFYSEKYGIYGRLDLFSMDKNRVTIVELKSGKPFRPNSYGLSNTHYHQTLLYDMLIESVYGTDLKRNNFILYSQEQAKPLRYAPSLKTQQRETIKARNRLYLHDRCLQKSADPLAYIEKYAQLHKDHIKGYQEKETLLLCQQFKDLDEIERLYVNRLITFTMNEWLISKIGHGHNHHGHGLAALWSQSMQEKQEQFNILNQLTLGINKADEEDPILIFYPSAETTPISNFRKGDLGVLYPYNNDTQAILQNQVFKVTILTLDDQSIVVRLRSRQDNAKLFRQYTYWNIEHDSLDNSYTEMTRAVAEWTCTDKSYRHLIMGRRMPMAYSVDTLSSQHHPQLTTEQSQLFREMISAQEYYMLWGPPGTGKTSIMLREIANHYLHHRSERILLLAYTNRAVDEICEALESIDPTPSYTRIGSRYSTAPAFVPHLLQEKTAHCTSRQALIDTLDHERIYVGTIASIHGKKTLFDLITFGVAIIDEASQILEHSLIGLLSRVQKFILIGDHKQLPAVVQQSPEISQINDLPLKSLGYDNLNTSLFERLYTTAVARQWHHAYGQLTYQGRMHTDLMYFPSKVCYNSQLKIIPTLNRLTASLPPYHGSNALAAALSHQRLSFIPSSTDTESPSIKVNIHEANICIQVISAFVNIYSQRQQPINEGSIGIITPYRAQIARIRQSLRKAHPELMEIITIDTVERYQGGARDIIIMSSCMNYAFQMNALVSLSSDGVDRKLNVALTRVREQFILIGNPHVLRQNTLYDQLIHQATSIEITSMS